MVAVYRTWKWPVVRECARYKMFVLFGRGLLPRDISKRRSLGIRRATLYYYLEQYRALAAVRDAELQEARMEAERKRIQSRRVTDTGLVITEMRPQEEKLRYAKV